MYGAASGNVGGSSLIHGPHSFLASSPQQICKRRDRRFTPEYLSKEKSLQTQAGKAGAPVSRISILPPEL
ncbi:hypothetical protein GDO81_023662 [Engystomops pustulosus]|uniref:Uncharacterized protein n=1 Tax=Engystomops pustulosus TaxID=76066 RepID=A0AAV6Z6L4_ENGPU|nr:hypothetical protein GDO81_023662 [Engystomops pustulosus]